MAKKKKRSWFADLLAGANAVPQPRRLTKKERRLQRRLEREAIHRTEFLDYLEWLLRQPDKVYN